MADKLIIEEARTTGLSWLGSVGLGSLGLGASLMYLLDPDQGRRRRKLIRDQATHSVHAGREFLRKAGVDLRNRLTGAAIDTRHRLEQGRVPDSILAERVRATMGRYVSHPGAIEVEADAGRVTLRGQVFTHEAPLLLKRVRHVRGVHEVSDALDRHHTADGIPALQGTGTLQYARLWERANWPPALRVVAGTTGFGLTSYGMRQQGIARIALSGAGLALTLRSLTNLPVRRLVGLEAGPEAVHIQKDIHIEAPVEEVFRFLQNFENLPRFMAHLRRVSVNGERSHWEAFGPAGIPVHWDQEVTVREPNRLLAWRSLPGSAVKSAGKVRFETSVDGTHVDIRLSYNPPAGAIGHAVAHLLGADPKQALDDDLQRLKSLLELGKATAHGETVSRDQL